MLGPLTVGKKAAKFGYRRFGKPGAVVFGAGSVGGYYLVKRKLKSKATQELREDAASERADERDASVESGDSSPRAE